MLTQNHTTGTSSQGLRRRSTMVIVSAMQISPKSNGRGDHSEVPTPTAVMPARAVRNGDPARASRTTSQANTAMSRACSNTTSLNPPIR